jgi:hypothetical protein
MRRDKCDLASKDWPLINDPWVHKDGLFLALKTVRQYSGRHPAW